MKNEIKQALVYLSEQEDFKGLVIQFTTTGFRALANNINTAEISAIIDELRVANSRQIAENQRTYKVEEGFRSFDDRVLVEKEAALDAFAESQSQLIKALHQKLEEVEKAFEDLKSNLAREEKPAEEAKEESKEEEHKKKEEEVKETISEATERME